jgi:hypothetical protein
MKRFTSIALTAAVAATVLAAGAAPARADWWQDAKNTWTGISFLRGSFVLPGNIGCYIQINSGTDMSQEELEACGVEFY